MKSHQNRQRYLFLLGLVLLLVAGSFRVSALDPNRGLHQYNCRTWHQANGLPANAVTAITQSADGRLWLGTSQGLVFFDGVGFRVFDLSVEGDLGSKIITSLADRPDGGLWIGLNRGGFAFFDGEQFHPLNRAEWNLPAPTTVRIVQMMRDGTTFVGGCGFAGKLTDKNMFKSLLPTTNADVFSVCEDTNGRIWMGTADDGLYYLEHGQMKRFADATLQKLIISSIVVDPAGNIWLGTVNGLRCYGANFRNKPLNVIPSQPRALLLDRQGALWIGTANSGLYRYYKGQFASLTKEDGLASDGVLSLAESDDGSLWVGTEDGLSQLSDIKFPILSTAEGLVNDDCLAVAASPQGGIWAGTANGVSYFSDGQFRNFGQDGAGGFGSRWVKRLFVAHNGDLYCIDANKNVNLFRGDHVVKTWNNGTWPRAVAEDSHGILVAMVGDLMRIENDKMVPVRLADGSNVSLRWISDVSVARDDSIWVAATEGIFQIKDGVISNLCHSNNVYQSTFYFLCEDDSGNIWAAQNTGIARFKNGKMRQITRQQGLHEDFVYAMVPDKSGNFWMDSSRGIFRVSQSELNAVAEGTAERVHCSVYEGENAVKSNDKGAEEYSGCRSLDGRIWFPGSKGVIMIDPTNVPSNQLPPVVFIERVRINGQECNPHRQPVLEPGPGNLEFDYSALDYQAPQKIQYRYRLTGYDADWVNAGSRREAFYTNLKPGDYRFQVEACNSDGVWNSTGAGFTLELPRKFQETPIFRITCLAALLGLVAYAWWVRHLRRRHIQLQQTSALLEAKVQERTAELRKEIEERKRMQLEIERVHRQLLDASRQAGMAEVATSVLHNVGNVLNSVNVSATLVLDLVKKSEINLVGQLADLIEAQRPNLAAFFTTDPRGEKLPAFLSELAKHLAGERATLVREVELTRTNIEHIKDIVMMQQNYASMSGLAEKVKVVDLVEDALRINDGALARHNVRIVRDFSAPDLDITVERHKVLQVLVNLIRNAKYACDESGRTDRQLTLQVRRDNGRVQIVVQDNGVGIPSENLTRIFNHGFTTRQNGHGFGLHSGALAAKEIGGLLTAHSDGPGTGARFVLELPLRTAENPGTIARTVSLNASA